MANDIQTPIPVGRQAAAIMILALQHFSGDLSDSAYFDTIQKAVQAFNGRDDVAAGDMSQADAELVATAFPAVGTAEDFREVERHELQKQVESLARLLAAEHGLKTLD